MGLWTSLGAWVGSWSFFAFVVSRVAFQVLPGDTAGDLAGFLLTRLHWGGAAAALIAAGCAFGLGRRGWLISLPVGLALVCLFNELWISPEVALVRPSTIGAASTEMTANRFRILHRLSLGLFLAVHFASMTLIVRHASLDAHQLKPRP
jgi:hypothetical protein